MLKISNLSSLPIAVMTVGGMALAIWALPSVPRTLTQPQKFSSAQFSELDQISQDIFLTHRLWFNAETHDQHGLSHTTRFELMGEDATGWDVSVPRTESIYHVTKAGKWQQGQWQSVRFEVGEPLLRHDVKLCLEQTSYVALLGRIETALNSAPDPMAVPQSHAWKISDFRVSGQLKGRFQNYVSSPAVHVTKDGIALHYATICDLRSIRGDIDEGTLHILAPVDISIPDEGLSPM